jgi:hypothetical protein
MSIKLRNQSLIVQLVTLRRNFGGTGDVRHSELHWRGSIEPTSRFRNYQIHICYKLHESPSVEVISPKLQTRDGKRPPHLYGDDRLCLYLPRADEWSGHMTLARTIVPWTSEWLFFYELWLATGEWLGGGVHPGTHPKSEVSENTQISSCQ